MGQSGGSNADMPGIDELRTNVLVALADTPHPLVAVTSPRADTRRLDVAAALAASVEQTGRRVALVDADVSETARRLGGARNRRDQGTAPGRLRIECRVAGRGGVSADLLADTADGNDLVVVACPPVLDVAETRAVTVACTATVLLASRRTSRRDSTVQAANVLREAGARLLGVALRRS